MYIIIKTQDKSPIVKDVQVLVVKTHREGLRPKSLG